MSGRGYGPQGDMGGAVTLSDFLAGMWRLRAFILAGICGGLILGMVFIGVAIPHKSAEVIIAPAVPMGAASSSPVMSHEDMFALRFLFQHVQAGQGSDFQRFENIYNGASVAGILLRDDRIREGLAQERGMSALSPIVASVMGAGKTRWNAEQFSAYLKKRIKLEPVGLGSARKMVYAHPDPDFAKYLLSAVHHIADGLIRRAVREDARARVNYLTHALAQTNNQEHRRALTQLLMEQERMLMLVSIDQPYAATIIEPPTVATRGDWPDIPFVLLSLSCIGAFMGVVVGAFLGRNDRGGYGRYA